MSGPAHPETDFTVLPSCGADVFAAPLQRPAHLGPDWLEPAQRNYDADEHRIWDDLFARQMQISRETAERWIREAGLDHVERGGQRVSGRAGPA